MSELELALWTVLAPSAVALIVALLGLKATPIAQALKLFDHPGGRKKHVAPTPLMGGLAILFSLIPILGAYAYFEGKEAGRVTGVICVTTAILAVLGIIDDRKPIAALPRLLLSVAIVLTAIIVEPVLQISSLVLGAQLGSIALGPLTIPATALCLVALVNAVNLADGKNGLVLGLCLSWALMLLEPAPRTLQPTIMCLAAASAMLLFFNVRGKLFLGDGGSYGFAVFIGLLAIYLYRRAPNDPSADLFALVFLIPVLDMARLMITRIAQGRSPFSGDRDHLHHYLLDEFGWPAGLMAYLILSIIPSFVAFKVQLLSLPILIGTVCMYFSTIIYIRHHRQRRARRPERRSDEGETPPVSAPEKAHSSAE